MVEIFYILKVCVHLAVIGGCFSLVRLYRDKIFSSIFLQIRIGYIGCNTSRKSQKPVLVEFPVSQPVEYYN